MYDHDSYDHYTPPIDITEQYPDLKHYNPYHLHSNGEATVTGSTGTIWVNSDWVPPGVPTVYQGVIPTGACIRNMYDRRDNSFKDRDAWCFGTIWEDSGKLTEIQVN